jgi:hypothetical protein
LPGKFRPEHSTEHVDELKGDSRQRAISVDTASTRVANTAPARITIPWTLGAFSAGNTTKDKSGATMLTSSAVLAPLKFNELNHYSG